MLRTAFRNGAYASAFVPRATGRDTTSRFRRAPVTDPHHTTPTGAARDDETAPQLASPPRAPVTEAWLAEMAAAAGSLPPSARAGRTFGGSAGPWAS